MNDQHNLWGKPISKALRWLAFIPIGATLAGILQMLPVLLFYLCFPMKVEPRLVRYIAAFVVVGVGFSVMFYWALCVFFVSVIACGKIAPNRHVAAIIYIILIMLSGTTYLLMIFSLNYPIPLILYHAVFFVISVVGAIYGGWSNASSPAVPS